MTPASLNRGDKQLHKIRPVKTRRRRRSTQTEIANGHALVDEMAARHHGPDAPTLLTTDAAHERVELGRLGDAISMACCGANFPGGIRNNCHKLGCTRCEARKAGARADKICGVAVRMRNPTAATLEYPSNGLDDLRETYDDLRWVLGVRVFGWLRRRGVENGCGVVELPLGRDRKHFHAHCHLILDLPEGFDADEFSRWFEKTTDWRGDVTWDGPVKSPERLSSYISKSTQTWPLPRRWLPGAEPDLGEEPIEVLRIRLQQLRAIQPVVGWGPLWSGRKNGARNGS